MMMERPFFLKTDFLPMGDLDGTEPEDCPQKMAIVFTLSL
jgi:hypothetical protein